MSALTPEERSVTLLALQEYVLNGCGTESFQSFDVRYRAVKSAMLRLHAEAAGEIENLESNK